MIISCFSSNGSNDTSIFSHSYRNEKGQIKMRKLAQIITSTPFYFYSSSHNAVAVSKNGIVLISWDDESKDVRQQILSKGVDVEFVDLNGMQRMVILFFFNLAM